MNDLSSVRPEDPATRKRGWVVVAALFIGYVGVYLCRKNLSVAVPLLQESFSASKEQVGIIASVGTMAYAAGKLLNGGLVDRIGARRGYLIALASVALFGAAGAFAPSIAMLAVFYGFNRYSGAAAWPAMIKFIPTWFGLSKTASVIGVLSLSYVLGGVAAVLVARQIVEFGGGWSAVMGWPSLMLVVLLVGAMLLVRTGPVDVDEPFSVGSGASDSTEPPKPARRGGHYLRLLRSTQFRLACGISFTVTLVREAFNVWSVDFLHSVQAEGEKDVAAAALHSVAFDLAGAVAILGIGVLYDRVTPSRRRWILCIDLVGLALVLALMPAVAGGGPWAGVVLIAAVGLLVYGPFSLLSGVIAIESGGAKSAATAAGIIDGVGYIAGILAGVTLGRLLDIGGYTLGFNALAGVTLASAVLTFWMRPPPALARTEIEEPR